MTIVRNIFESDSNPSKQKTKKRKQSKSLIDLASDSDNNEGG